MTLANTEDECEDEDDGGGQLQPKTHNDRELSTHMMTQRLQVFCGYWLVNQTQMVLKLRAKKDNSKSLSDLAVVFKFLPQPVSREPHDGRHTSNDSFAATADDWTAMFENVDEISAPAMYSGNNLVHLSVSGGTGDTQKQTPANDHAFSSWSKELDISLTDSGVVYCLSLIHI